jgi:DnaJ domain
VTELATAVVSIARTQRGRFFWAAWWTGPPTERPFRKPDAANGGARSLEDARAEAERAAGRALTEIDVRWARAFTRTLRGQPAFTDSEVRAAREPAPAPRAPRELPRSIWAVLGLPGAGATLAEIKRAYRARALEVHPDRGGTDDAFRELRDAYEEALRRAQKKARRPLRNS